MTSIVDDLEAWDRAHGGDPQDRAGHRDPAGKEGHPVPDPTLRRVDCPKWCGPNWHSEDQMHDRAVWHGTTVASAYLPDVTRYGSEPTRPTQGRYELTVESEEDRTSRSVAPDNVVVLTAWGPGPDWSMHELRLMLTVSGEPVAGGALGCSPPSSSFGRKEA